MLFVDTDSLGVKKCRFIIYMSGSAKFNHSGLPPFSALSTQSITLIIRQYQSNFLSVSCYFEITLKQPTNSKAVRTSSRRIQRQIVFWRRAGASIVEFIITFCQLITSCLIFMLFFMAMHLLRAFIKLLHSK